MKICYPAVHYPYQLGKRYVADNVPILPFDVAENIDYEALGLNIQNNQNGEFTDSGYVFDDETIGKASDEK